MFFADRTDAGKKLAARLSKYKGTDSVILAIPRGGVAVAAGIAKELDTCISLIIPRKIGAPHNPELAIGAVTMDGTLVLDEELVASLNVSPEYLEKEKAVQIQEIRRRVLAYGAGRLIIGNKTVIIVDDGIATGATMKAAILSVKKKNPAKLVVAVPVAPKETVKELGKEVDEIVCLHAPAYFGAVGEFYGDFSQTGDVEVMDILESFR
ncbi:MAG: phosphoribosyltransferase [Candidatus Altiarchaeota archaeon]|nr:phosphoribosyltransferase [Candidatus Altiarchaeota archaeon]